MNNNLLIDSLIKVADHWLQDDVLRQKACREAAAEFCLSAPNFLLALDWIFSEWREETLRSAMLNNAYSHHHYVVQILAGNTPAMIAQGLLQAVILKKSQTIKVPKGQSRFAELLYKTFLTYKVPMPAIFEMHTWENRLSDFYDQLRKADLVIAYGQDDTLNILKQYLAPDTVYIGHGHAESAAILLKEAANPEHLEKLAYDMLSYDQRGCLSPRVTFIEAGGDYSPTACAQFFSEKILPSIAKALPRGGLFSGEGEELHHQQNRFRFRGTVYTGSDWTVCFDNQATWPDVFLPRFMVFQSFNSLEDLQKRLGTVLCQLKCLGYAGSKTRLDSLNLSVPLKELGTMQKQLLFY